MNGLVLLNNIGDDNWSFDWRLTKNFFLAKIENIQFFYHKKLLSRVIEKTIFRIRELSLLLNEVYKETLNIKQDEAVAAYPVIIKIRKTITKQNKRFRTINYADSEELKRVFISLVRLVNRIEARLLKKKNDENKIIETPKHIKEKMALNSKKIVGDAILQEANS